MRVGGEKDETGRDNDDSDDAEGLIPGPYINHLIPRYGVQTGGGS